MINQTILSLNVASPRDRWKAIVRKCNDRNRILPFCSLYFSLAESRTSCVEFFRRSRSTPWATRRCLVYSRRSTSTLLPSPADANPSFLPLLPFSSLGFCHKLARGVDVPSKYNMGSDGATPSLRKNPKKSSQVPFVRERCLEHVFSRSDVGFGHSRNRDAEANESRQYTFIIIYLSHIF